MLLYMWVQRGVLVNEVNKCLICCAAMQGMVQACQVLHEVAASHMGAASCTCESSHKCLEHAVLRCRAWYKHARCCEQQALPK